MSDEEKKKGDYEKPESHGVDDELEGVSGGAGQKSICMSGHDEGICLAGGDAGPRTAECKMGPKPAFSSTPGG